MTKNEGNRTTKSWNRSLRALFVIAIGEWKRFVFTLSFVLFVLLPPLVVVLYPLTYELISNGIQNWHEEKNRQARSPRTIPQISVDSNISSSEVNTTRFAVIDRSAWVHQKVKEKLLRNDLHVFLKALFNLDESEFAQWAQNATDKLSDDQPIRDPLLFQSSLIEFQHTLIEKGSIHEQVMDLAKRLEEEEGTKPTHSSTDSVLELWTKAPENIIEIAPLVSFAFFKEMETEDGSFDRMQSMLNSRTISGYFIIPSSILDNNDGLQLVVLQETPRSIVDELKIFYQSQLRDVIREQKLTQTGRFGGEELPLIEIRQNEIEHDSVGLSTNRLRDKGWGSPVIIASFISEHLPVIVSLIVLTCVVFSGPVFALSTLEERSSKLAETLLASTNTKLLFDAKTWGGTAGFVSILCCWLVFRVVYLLVVTPDMPFEILPNLHTAHLLHWSLFLLLVFSFYGYIVVALGSMCNNQIDLIACAVPLFLIFSVTIVVVFDLFENPSSLSASILSFFPPFTAFVMIGRSGVLPPWPIYLTISTLLLVSVFGVREIGSSFFSRAFLLENKPRGIKDIVRIARNPR